jgi:lipopolysaccharide exporter
LQNATGQEAPRTPEGAPEEEPPLSQRSTHQANIVTRAVRGAFWTVLSGTGARFLGILGTLAITHYLSPDEYGEVSLAALVTMTASMVANCGLSQYIASKPNAGRAAVFHATFYFIVTGAIALALSVVGGEPFGRLINAPNIGRLLPALAVAAFLDRLCTIQDRIQLRDMRFRSVSVQRSLGELVYSAVSVALAATCANTMFGGPFALVWATVARSVVRLGTLTATTRWREWIEPHPITRAQSREFFAFGLPMSVATVAGFGSSKFDNFVFSHHFGKGAAGTYNLAYNFADIPASLIAETVGDVLVPSFAHMQSDEHRKDGLLLSLRTLVFVVTPLAIGLAMVAPTLVKLAFPPRYEGIIPALRILAMFAVPRTILWTCNSYLQVRNRPRLIMILETLRMLGIVVFMHVCTLVALAFFPGAAVLVACAAVVMVFTLSAFSYMLAIRKIDGVPLVAQVLPFLPPSLACVPMILAVYGARQAMWRWGLFALDHHAVTFTDRFHVFAPRLLVEILVGAVVFVPSALILSPRTARDFLRLILDAVKRRRHGEGDHDGGDAKTPGPTGAAESPLP